MEATRIFDLLEGYAKEYRHKEDALAGKTDGKWVKYSSVDYVEYAELISLGLLALGLKKGDKIATISNNRPEWNFMDMGMAQLGIINVPIYPTISDEDITYILSHANPVLLVLSDYSLYKKVGPIAATVKTIKGIYSFNEIDKVKNWKEIIGLGKTNKEKYESILNDTINSIKPEEMATIIYTSGTTGNPKGVMLSHHNIMSNVKAACQIFHFNHSCLLD